ncbi:26651_t:CDS:1, partial [Dentiscutata erythropus]
MAKFCNPSMNKQDLMNAANKKWQKYKKESEATIKNQINQYLIASPSIVRTTTFFLLPSLPNIHSLESSTSNSASSRLLAPNSSSLLLVEIPIIISNTLAQHKFL